MESYKNLQIYKEASKSFKRSLDEYIKTYRPSNDQVYYQLELYRYTHLDKREARRKNPVAAMIILFLVLILVFVNNSLNASKAVIIISTVLMVALTIVYFSGLVDDSKIQIKKIRKELAKFPETPDFNGPEK